MSDTDEMTLAEFILSQGADNPKMMESLLGQAVIRKAKLDFQQELRKYFDEAPTCFLSEGAEKCVAKAVKYQLAEDFIYEMSGDFESEFGYWPEVSINLKP